MAYNVIGTGGGDSLDQSASAGPGTITGLAGDDSILTGSGSLVVFGNSGNDTVFLQTGNTGTVNGGTESDLIDDQGTDIGSMVLLGGDGSDTISTPTSTSSQTIIGGNDSADGGDFIVSSTGDDLIFGNGGDDFVFSFPDANGTVIGGHGDDVLLGGTLIFGNEGSDSVFGNDTATVFGGLGDDVISGFEGQFFGNEGADTIDVAGAATVVGGNGTADGDDYLLGSDRALMFGNGGNDTLETCGCEDTNTLIGGFGDDEIFGGPLIFGNEGDDFILAVGTSVTVFGGLGNDGIVGDIGRDTIQGNEGNDTLEGFEGVDTISGGSGNDLFAYELAEDDGDNATGGGPVERITDLNFDQDRFLLTVEVTFAANLGAGTGTNLNASANNAIAAAYALAGGGAAVVAAQFTFGGRTYLAIDEANAGAFDDTDDLLIDITGATGTIGANDFTID
jgi:Ca2+-binding RTX toxin-like protein